jgi:hypothetical protein
MVVEIVVKMVLDVVVNLDAAIVPKIVYLILVVVPLRFVDGVSWVPIIPKVLVVRPLIVPILTEVTRRQPGNEAGGRKDAKDWINSCLGSP